ncbi:MAG: DUF5330 domain-containing protein [Xanthobacteraceae bacterium]|nr:DUF5330 domain-containing protein [Xanthobacteraceae bacterium]QYK45787.1 MAG: DUF5330 domain-containing protein [Xanthobacteraceae bacterium]HMN50984.1 DUF5330 domain-containing protein [Xanthobacteraceae bacterium]
MGFLFRLAFWLIIVIALLPSDPKNDPKAPQVSTFEAIGAATTALSDARSFCQREPKACEVGSQALHVFTQKAQYGAKMLYEYLSAATGENSPRAEVTTGSTPKVQPGRNTLTGQDLIPVWQQPQKQKLAGS